MNTANLQLEGLLLAISRLLETARRKGLLTQQEIETALQEADLAARQETQARNLSPAQAEGVRFPIRFLLAATNLAAGSAPTFGDTAALVGEQKDGRQRR
ncbi:hypothetical protein J5J86_15110 [Aquabacter sp. L1I39]|uniref:hypothetical protein n=1 Tax=Aquabacter sp. L1I39 TaxID=2820278 RepID=UPI001ADA849E|nr:hypothetical protein [Aquabacter sp. L1I39]QTL02127.1 hypothetical protein J5J86_15110 [Aquabacter sp. L1I39]